MFRHCTYTLRMIAKSSGKGYIGPKIEPVSIVRWTHQASSGMIKEDSKPAESKRLEEFRKKLEETPEIPKAAKKVSPDDEPDPLPPWPDNTNPHTGEIGGPKGLEPTRYGDWERKGRAIDF